MTPDEHLARLITERPSLEGCKADIYAAYEVMRDSYAAGGKLLLCGNGGSACDCEHIAGELMKGFLLKRPLSAAQRRSIAALADALPALDASAALDLQALSDKLQRALPCIVLSSLPGLSSAFLNDVDGRLTYAQQTFTYAAPGDVLLGITTSGNAQNVCMAALAAKAKGARVLGLTGEGGGRLVSVCDVCVRVPERETYRVQELHLPVYHALCCMLEAHFFEGGE